MLSACSVPERSPRLARARASMPARRTIAVPLVANRRPARAKRVAPSGSPQRYATRLCVPRAQARSLVVVGGEPGDLLLVLLKGGVADVGDLDGLTQAYRLAGSLRHEGSHARGRPSHEVAAIRRESSLGRGAY